MNPSQTAKREQALLRAIRRLDRMKGQGTCASRNFSRWRLGVFLTGTMVCVGFYQQAWFHTGNFFFTLFLSGFLTISFFHQRLKTRLQRLDDWLSMKHTTLARLRLDWGNIPDGGHIPPSHHPYALDLDLTGHHSLLTLLDTTFSTTGRRMLERWVFQANDPCIDSLSWDDRQAFVKELTPLSRLRDRSVLATHLIGPGPLDGERITALIQHPAALPALSWMLPLSVVLTGTTAGLVLWTIVGNAPNYWLISLIAYAVLYFMVSGAIQPVFGRVLALHAELEKLVTVIGLLERYRSNRTPMLQQLCAALIQGAHRPSRHLSQLGRICQGLSVKAHPLIHLGVNILFPWDFWFVNRLNATVTDSRRHLPDWLQRIGVFDAASALARFAYLNPEYVWPALSISNQHHSMPGITAHRLGHPLLDRSRRVANDVDHRGEGQVLLITGSNMSGKSTFLRTIGINLCLAQAGGPVCAERFSWTWLRLYCCIRVTDALDEGLSYFYAEVKRLKVILDAVQEPNATPVLFLIDEIYRGTNNRERLAGSQAFIQALEQSRGLGLVSTHDLELTRLAESNSHIQNAHFQETVRETTLFFDYRLRPGPCPTTNALRIMEQEGLPVPKKEMTGET